MDPVLLRLLVVVGVVAVATVAGALWQRRDGRLTAGDGRAVTLDDADRPTALLFGSETCAPCDTVKDLLREVETERPGFRWTYLDAAEHLDLATEHRVRRVPTLLVLDRDGRVTARTSGVPARDELRAAIDAPLQRAG